MPRPINTRPPSEHPRREPQTPHDEHRRCDSPPRGDNYRERVHDRQPPVVPPAHDCAPPPQKKGLSLPFIGRLRTDDLILLAVIFLLLSDDCDDKLLLLALAYVFFADYFD